jgi:hypothetical protein
MEGQCSLPCSQQPALDPNLNHLNIVGSKFTKWLFSLSFCDQQFVRMSYVSIAWYMPSPSHSRFCHPNNVWNTSSYKKYVRKVWPRCRWRRSAAGHLLELRVRIPPGEWMFFCCECRVLSEVSATGRSLVQRSPIESVCYWVWSGVTITIYICNE